MIAGAYPGRKVVAVTAPAIAYGGGGVHCITQQIPATQQNPDPPQNLAVRQIPAAGPTA